MTNNTGAQIDTSRISVPIRGPSGQGLDLTCPGSSGLSIPPGHSFTCTVSGSFPYSGTYTFWADWLYIDNTTWHQGQLGANQQFKLS